MSKQILIAKSLILAGYIRVSSVGQEDGTSLELQARQLEKWCAENGHVLKVIFFDADSGENMTGRAGFKAALKYCNDNADGLVVADLDRFSRSSFDSGVISKIFKAKGKKLLSASQSFDLEDKYGRFGFTVNQAVAELVREQIKERCHSNRMLKVENGGWIGHRPAYGYKAVQGENLPDEEEQWVIRFMARLHYWAHMPQGEIAAYLNAKLDNGDWRFLCKQVKPAIRARKRPFSKDFTYSWGQGMISKILSRKHPNADGRPRLHIYKKASAKHSDLAARSTEVLSEVVKAHLLETRDARRRGEQKPKWHRPPFGHKYENGVLVKDVQEQWVIRYIVRLHKLCGMSQERIVVYLNVKVQQGDWRFLTKTSKSSKQKSTSQHRLWSQSTVSKLLRRSALKVITTNSSPVATTNSGSASVTVPADLEPFDTETRNRPRTYNYNNWEPTPEALALIAANDFSYYTREQLLRDRFRDRSWTMRFIFRLEYWCDMAPADIMQYLNAKLDAGDHRFSKWGSSRVDVGVSLSEETAKRRQKEAREYRWEQNHVEGILQSERYSMACMGRPPLLRREGKPSPIVGQPPFGFSVSKGILVVNESEQWLMRIIGRLQNWTGLSQTEISDYLNKKLLSGDMRFQGRTRWNQPTVCKICKSPGIKKRSLPKAKSLPKETKRQDSQGLLTESLGSQLDHYSENDCAEPMIAVSNSVQSGHGLDDLAGKIASGYFD